MSAAVILPIRPSIEDRAGKIPSFGKNFLFAAFGTM
jgi:hypothetical protein